MRLTQSNLDQAFANFCNAIGFRVASAYNDVGALRIEHANGVYTIYRIGTEHGGVSHFGPYTWYTLRELYEHLQFTTRVIQDKQWLEDFERDCAHAQ